MTDSAITVTDQETGEEVRTITRLVGGATHHIQGVVPYRAGIMNYWTLFGQELGNGSLGDVITLKSSRTAKPDESGSTTGSQYRVLTRRPFPSDTISAAGYIEKTTQSTSDNTTVINCCRFFLDEAIQEDLLINGSIRVRLAVGVKTNNASGTAYLQQVVVKLRQLTATDTYSDVATKTVTVTTSNATTSYVDKSVVVNLSVSAGTIDKDDDLLLEITTNGKISNASYVCTHILYFNAGTSRCYVEIPVEEA